MRILFIIMLLTVTVNFGQVDYEEPEIEIFLIDSYITPEKPHKFKLTFFTSDSCKSKVLIADDYELVISDDFTEDHRSEIDFTDFEFDSLYVPFYLTVENEEGTIVQSELYEVMLPSGTIVSKDGGSSLFTMCCVGGVIFGLPSPTYIYADGENYFGLSKEIPLFNYYSGGYNYPNFYFSLEYSYIFNSSSEHFLRLGGKKIFQIDALEYIAPGLNVFTDFNGFNGISPELSIGWFKVYNVFTVYSRYRYNIKPSGGNPDFHEISIGLYSTFFSINL
ncbi:MAG: hypothetical protein K9J16_06590 [Melioribacteraceae bacterium]|nr:hypothetical protein [Melioribacteraceae bacterium]MCF8353100.1 hypothetical protein [Melioribacteraceae bacterium]MCF8392754.1 hypothetical protein [Melioribacteraceae bacterium]MCF8418285.1 hypothetical protein [Melioribacteraceae bacterium]